jgi:hypothetical protein
LRILVCMQNSALISPSQYQSPFIHKTNTVEICTHFILFSYPYPVNPCGDHVHIQIPPYPNRYHTLRHGFLLLVEVGKINLGGLSKSLLFYASNAFSRAQLKKNG